MYLLTLTVDAGDLRVPLEVRFEVPGQDSDDYARKVARGIRDAYAAVLGDRVLTAGLQQTDMVRDLGLPDDPDTVEREQKLPKLPRPPKTPPPPPDRPPGGR